MRFYFFPVILFFLSACVSNSIDRTPSSVSVPYCGCLVFIDDVKNGEDLNYALSLKPDFLLRSWYRWGEPSENKAYSKRRDIVELATSQKVGIGGGTSLSIVNDRDLTQPDFDKSWLSVDLKGLAINRDGRQFGSLSSPGFRKYLVSRLLEQARTGVLEIHLGESSGEIQFDDWTLGLKGDFGFVLWLRNKYPSHSQQWWVKNFGELGRNIYERRPIERANFLKMTPKQSKNFENEFGKTGSWDFNDAAEHHIFLRDMYRHNLESFLGELRSDLDQNGYKNVVIDVWGFASWMSEMSVQPNAYLSTPPDERWKLNWSTDPNFDLSGNRELIKQLMQNQMASVKPVPVIYMIDHSKPFDDFKKLSDARQAEATQFFADISKEIGANFVFRTYSTERNLLGPKTDNIIKTQCRLRKRNFCPSNN